MLFLSTKSYSAHENPSNKICLAYFYPKLFMFLRKFFALLVLNRKKTPLSLNLKLSALQPKL